MFDIINKPFGFVLEKLADIFGGSFAWAVFAFTVVINVILIPLTIKGQKSSVQQTRLKPKLDEIKKRYGDDRQKFAEAQQKLYQEEGVSMSGGCLPMLLRLVIMLSIYTLILSPLTYMAGANSKQISNVTTQINETLVDLQKGDKAEKESYTQFVDDYAWDRNRSELGLVNLIRSENGVQDVKKLLGKKKFAKIQEDLEEITLKDKETHIDYTLISEDIDLTQKPKFSFDIFGKFQKIWLIPICAFLAQMLTSVMSMAMQKKINPEAPSMAGMMLTMPLISLFIGFTLPGGVGFYWICSSLIGGFIQIGVQQFYGPHKMLSKERAKELVKQCDFEANQIKKISTEE